MFGMPPYGGRIAQNVYFADDSLCGPYVNTTKGYPERPDGLPWPSPFILMVDRGDCPFTTKVSVRFWLEFNMLTSLSSSTRHSGHSCFLD